MLTATLRSYDRTNMRSMLHNNVVASSSSAAPQSDDIKHDSEASGDDDDDPGKLTQSHYILESVFHDWESLHTSFVHICQR